MLFGISIVQICLYLSDLPLGERSNVDLYRLVQYKIFTRQVLDPIFRYLHFSFVQPAFRSDLDQQSTLSLYWMFSKVLLSGHWPGIRIVRAGVGFLLSCSLGGRFLRFQR